VKRLRLLREEGGFSLVFTLLTMLVTTVTLTAAIEYTSSNSRSANRSKADQIAYALAEAGLANGAAVLSNPSNNALDPTVLPSSEPDESNPAHADYIDEMEGGTVKWWGVLTGHQWIMHGVGIVEDPTGRTHPVRREATSTIKIQPSLTQTLNSNAWNYMFAKNTADPCDVTFSNNISVDASLFILGDLCFTNSSRIEQAAAPELTNLLVGQHVWFGGTGSIGSASERINEAHIAGGCRVGGVAPGTAGETWSACSSATRVHAGLVTSNPLITDGGPTADFDYWYTNAKPGPTQFCTSSSGVSATAFESSGSTVRNGSASAFNLTPASSYTCRYYDIPPNDTDLLGELSWNNATKTLSVKGVIYIDGSAYVSNNAVNRYVGLGTLYLSGTFEIDGNSELCGGISGGHCDFNAWDPNANNFGIIVDGNDGTGYSVKLQNQARYQGSIYSTNGVLLESFTKFDGPMVAGTFTLENNVETHEFPTITSVPIGWPGNPTVYAEPQPPQNYSG
jgi:Tfp pilus assembly protein PilV